MRRRVTQLLACILTVAIIGTASAARKEEPLKIVTFPIGDLAVYSETDSGVEFDARVLIAFIKASVSPESWEGNGGEAELMQFDKNKSLVVSQTEANHGRISELLKAFRESPNQPVLGFVK
jgi:hypothetical protein